MRSHLRCRVSGVGSERMGGKREIDQTRAGLWTCKLLWCGVRSILRAVANFPVGLDPTLPIAIPTPAGLRKHHARHGARLSGGFLGTGGSQALQWSLLLHLGLGRVRKGQGSQQCLTGKLQAVQLVDFCQLSGCRARGAI